MTLLLLLRSHGEAGPTPDPPVLVWPLGTANYPAPKRTTMSSFSVHKNDVLTLAPTLIEGVGTSDEGAANLTGATSVKFQARARSDGAVKINAAGTIVSAAAGTVSYPLTALNTDTAGAYDITWEVTFPSGPVTFPSNGFDLMVVLDDIG